MYVYAHTQRTDLDVSACPSTDLMFSGLLRKVISAEVETCRAFASSPDPPATRRSRSAPFPWIARPVWGAAGQAGYGATFYS